jgi:hypothetical protein
VPDADEKVFVALRFGWGLYLFMKKGSNRRYLLQGIINSKTSPYLLRHPIVHKKD